MTKLMPDGFPIPTVRKFGAAIESDAVILNGNDARGYWFECSRCGKMWGPVSAHPTGFVSAAANRHAANCGLPPKMSDAQWWTLRGLAHSVVYAGRDTFVQADWHRRPRIWRVPDFPKAPTLKWLIKWRLAEARPYGEDSKVVRIQITPFGRDNLGDTE